MRRLTITLLMLLACVNFIFAQPGTDAPTPIHASADVISVFSDAYTNLSGTNLDLGWSPNTNANIIVDGQDSLLSYTSFDYEGSEFTPQNLTGMDTLHVDMWTANATTVNVFCIDTDRNEKGYALPIVHNSWQSYDIPLSYFADVIDLTKVFRFKFNGGDGSTNEIYLDNLYFWKKPAAIDITLSDLTLDGSTITGFNPNVKNYDVGLTKGAAVPTVAATATDNAASVAITQAGSTLPDTAQIVITGSDGTTKDTVRVAFAVTKPGTDAPTPNHDPANVISVFSDTYTNLSGTNFDLPWNQSTDATIIVNGQDSLLSYTKFSFQGTEFTPQNLTGMDTLHLDMWTANATTVNIICFDTDKNEKSYSLPIIKESWQSYDIPLSYFADAIDLTKVYRFKFNGGNGTTDEIYLDNLYFWKKPATIDISLSDLTLDGSTISGFNPNVKNYDVGLAKGAAVPTVAATATDNAASVAITQAGSTLPDTAQIVITGSDGTTKDTVRVAFAVTKPGTDAPPPNHDPANVISVFSDTYTNLSGTNFDLPWNQSTDATIIVDGQDSLLSYTSFSFQGTEFTPQNLTGMDTLHLDMWTANATTVNIICFDTDKNEKSYSLPIVKESWQSYDIPLSYFADVIDLSKVYRLKFNGGNGTTDEIYLDNLYFWKKPAAIDITLSDLTLDGSTISGFHPNVKNYDVGLAKGATVPNVAATATDNAASVAITQAGSTLPDTAQIVITGSDGTTKDTVRVSFAVTKPGTNAPTPNHASANVISVFSDTYTNLSGTNFDLPWNQSTDASIIVDGQDSLLSYTKFSFQGTEFTPQNLSSMDTLHLDMWTANATTVNVFLIDTDKNEKSYSLSIVKESWQSYDIPLSYFADVIDLSKVYRFKFNGGNGTSDEIYLDNLYFWKEPLATVSTLSNLMVDDISIPGFNAELTTYEYEVPYGTSVFPTVSYTVSDASASAKLIAATVESKTDTVIVTAQDGSVTKYTVKFIYAAANTEATLKELALDGTPISGFKADSLEYSVELPFGTTYVPEVTALSTHDSATFVITQAATLSDTAIVVVTAQDGTSKLTYEVSFTVSEFISTDATLQDIKVSDVSLPDFAADKYLYTVELPFETTSVPKVEGIKTNLAATVAMDTAKTLADTAVITVTAQDGVSSLVYIVAFAIADPVYDVTFVVSDGAKGLLKGAKVAFMLDTLTTDINGSVIFNQVSVTTDAAYSVSLEGYEDVTGTLSVVDADVTKEIVMTLKTYDVKFNVADEAGKAIAMAEVVFQNDTINTDSAGLAVFSKIAPVANAAYSVSKAGYFATAGKLSVVDSAVVTNVALQLEAYDVKFAVIAADSLPIAMAEVVFNNDTVSTDSSGMALFASVVPNVAKSATYAYSVAKDGYFTKADSISVVDSAVGVSVMLEKEAYDVTFTVVDGNANIIKEAQVVFLGDTLLTDTLGVALFAKVAPVADTAFSVMKDGYVSETDTIAVVDSAVDVKVVLQEVTYAVTFTVVDEASAVVEGAEVNIAGVSVLTNAEGIAVIDLAPITDAAYTVNKEGFVEASGIVTVIDTAVSVGVSLEAVTTQTYSVTFTIVDGESNAIEGAEVVLLETTVTTDAEGKAVFTELAPITDAEFSVSKDGYEAATGTVSVVDEDVALEVVLTAVGVKHDLSLISNIYPNPTSGKLNIELSNSFTNAIVKVYSAQGRIVEYKELFEMHSTLDLSTNKAGIYLVNIELDGHMYYGRVIINK